MKSILCIPGNWADRSELLSAVVKATEGKYLMAGSMLFNTTEKHHFIIEVCEHDPMMHIAFSIAGMVTRYSEEELLKIADHKLMVYITGDTGDLIQAKHLADAAAMLLKAGGLGVKVETSGKAFEKGHWLTQLEDFEPHKLYPLFVVDSIVDGEGTVYSCGMHNLGLPDTIVSGEAFQEAVDLIQIFSYYQIVDKPAIAANQTFGVAEDAPVYRIIAEDEQPNKGHELFENPFGMWRLKLRE
jgi:hypothetical protein